MKKIILTISTAILAFSFVPNEAKAARTHAIELTNDSAKMEITLLHRLNEIKGMDMSTLNRSEKKALKKEVRTSESRLRHLDGGGIYISVGGLLLVILILLIIF